MEKSTERFELLVQIDDAIWNKKASENNKYAKILELFKSNYPNFDEMSAGYYYMYFALLIRYLETDAYSFENAASYFEILVPRYAGENKDYWICADCLRRNTLHGKEFYEGLKQLVIYQSENMFVRDLDNRYECENNSVKGNAR